MWKGENEDSEEGRVREEKGSCGGGGAGGAAFLSGGRTIRKGAAGLLSLALSLPPPEPLLTLGH